MRQLFIYCKVCRYSINQCGDERIPSVPDVETDKDYMSRLPSVCRAGSAIRPSVDTAQSRTRWPIIQREVCVTHYRREAIIRVWKAPAASVRLRAPVCGCLRRAINKEQWICGSAAFGGGTFDRADETVSVSRVWTEMSSSQFSFPPESYSAVYTGDGASDANVSTGEWRERVASLSRLRARTRSRRRTRCIQLI